ncbi:MAG: 16S rRNA (cytosine(1402)-N(4))-methyltransferase RsmH [Parcubacteria group bacterium]|nr:16S rRNA (cytosine(1402)-N(4))-methyltransferase RsmH [Parcubacteria group bacterium]
MDHIPVLLKEILKYLDPKPGQNFIDCTVGFAGHSLAILKKIKPNGKVLGIELNERVFKKLKLQISDQNNISVIHENFINLEKIVKENNFYPVSGILFDLGTSSWQIEKSGQGFSFQKDEPLDMRSDNKNNNLTAEEIINNWEENRLKQIFQEYGEERFSGRIARIICEKRQNELIKTTNQLVEVIRQVVPVKYRYRRKHFATCVFQSLRIAVNNELENLTKVLPQALKILQKHGKLAIISFHSLEDRIVKNFFREQAKEGNLEILFKKPVVPTEQEIEINPRSRSAKLRVAVKLL